MHMHLCTYICVHTYLHTCDTTYTYVNVLDCDAHAHIHVYLLYAHMHVCKFVYACTYACVRLCMHLCFCRYADVYLQGICTHLYMYTHICSMYMHVYFHVRTCTCMYACVRQCTFNTPFQAKWLVVDCYTNFCVIRVKIATTKSNLCFTWRKPIQPYDVTTMTYMTCSYHHGITAQCWCQSCCGYG